MTSPDPFLEAVDDLGDDSQLDTGAVVPPSVSTGGASRPAGSRSGIGARLVALVAVASLVSATLAATATVTIVGVGHSAGPIAPGSTPVANALTTSANNGSSSTAGETIVQVASAATPSVVTIDTTVTASGPFGGGTGGTGSGFVYDSSGLILTNDHVIEGADQITVTLLDGRHFDGSVVASDASLDLAVVKVNATGLPTLALGTSDQLQVGQTLIAIGSPLGTYTGSVTSGILSATGRTITVADEITRRPHQLSGLIQTDAAINPGNSGGPIIDLAGHVVGIATATSTTAEGLGFAVPITAATRIVASVRSTST
ncbi:MAG TPA: trypsin-like peptidase domain-containing protein [Candidatus Limnocylindrales bacterium]